MSEDVTFYCDCGEPWFAVAPGTAPSATRFEIQGALELFPADAAPMQVWCQKHWLETFGAKRRRHA